MRRTIIKTFFALVILAISILWLASNTEQVNKNKKSLTEYEKYASKKMLEKREGKAKADEPEMHALIEREIRTRIGTNDPEYGPNQVLKEYEKAKKNVFKARTSNDELNFIERGPGNVAGRTRALLVDPDDASGNTWYAGSASGGIWKTSDAGANWAFISDDIPNLGTNTLAMSPANTSIIYAGTGEHFTQDIDGAGLFKSSDKGATWEQVASPEDYSDFKNVSRIVVDPLDADIVIATTRNSVWEGRLEGAIYKTTDGGSTWVRLRSSTSERYDDLLVDPDDFNTVYVAVQGIGVIKSTDGGTSWSDASSGMSPGGRVEIAISPVNSNRLWASVEGGLSGNGSDLYVSSDGAETWSLAVNSSGTNEDFLGGQGWYDNYATAHPFDEDIVYVGGVNNWKFEITEEKANEIITTDIVGYNTSSFWTFVNFNSADVNGVLALGNGVGVEDLRNIEIRFGQGTQMAHRFTVGGQGPGVPASQYVYAGYGEVPFQVWDLDNDIQLMASFRDQQEDGSWNLIERNTDGDGSDDSREYLFVHDVQYSSSPDANIAVNGGHEVSQFFNYWPVLTPGGNFDPDNLPESALRIERNTTSGLIRITTNVSDAYRSFGGTNSFPQSARTAGIHPDQHNNVITDIDETNQTFRMIIANDGGVYQSVSSNDPGPNNGDFTYVSYEYNTTQFYGADKAPGENRFIGGMQDNGTWYHAAGTEGAASAESTFGIGGDGFEALWHSADINKMIGGSQYSNFARTSNGGQSWTSATSGLSDVGAGSGPFRSRLSHHKQLPDRLHTVGASGIWRSENFGGAWSAASLTDANLWTTPFSNNTDIEVSYADPDVIWAGARMYSEGRPFVSTDGGENYSPVENYSAFEMGSISGIGTHPFESETAYVLFSFAGYPKVIKTTDLGQNWSDISGFDGTGDRGFPDVAVNTLFVFPTNTDRVWVGSEIGIIESLDGGDSWGLLQSNMPAVNIHDFKLVENQLVIATYGRGIWSVELTGIINAPSFRSASTAPNGEINLAFNFLNEFDSTEIYVNNTSIGTIYNNVTGSVNEKINDSNISGTVSIRLDAYLGGNKYSSPELETFILGVTEIKSSFSSEFEDASDFDGFGFVVKDYSGFENSALHSAHNYEDGVESIFYLRTPITVASSEAFMKYVDMAIVEPGEPGSSYPDEDFYDYVVVEASKDGETWVALEDGYDASLHVAWLNRYNISGPGNSNLFKPHSVDLLEKFEAGDDIIIRFRLFADVNTNAFGWVIDDLYIQEDEPLSTENLVSTISVFPNPIVGAASIQLNTEITDNRISVFNASGKLVDFIDVEANQQIITWTPSNLETGIYILKFNSSNGLVNKKVFIN